MMVQILLEHCGRSWSPLIFLFIILLLFFLFHAVTTPHTPSPGPRVRVTPGTLPRAGTTAHHEARHWHWPAEGTRGGTLRAPLERLSRGSCLAAALANQLVLRPVLLLSEHTNCFPVWRLGRTGGGGERGNGTGTKRDQRSRERCCWERRCNGCGDPTAQLGARATGTLPSPPAQPVLLATPPPCPLPRPSAPYYSAHVSAHLCTSTPTGGRQRQCSSCCV